VGQPSGGEQLRAMGREMAGAGQRASGAVPAVARQMGWDTPLGEAAGRALGAAGLRPDFIMSMAAAGKARTVGQDWGQIHKQTRSTF
jgi:hypothetical protein